MNRKLLVSLCAVFFMCFYFAVWCDRIYYVWCFEGQILVFGANIKGERQYGSKCSLFTSQRENSADT